jgi:hypothetical protein
LQDKTKKVLLSAIKGCTVQIKLLEDIIVKVLLILGDFWAKRGKKAPRSLRYDIKVKKITVVVHKYI